MGTRHPKRSRPSPYASKKTVYAKTQAERAGGSLRNEGKPWTVVHRKSLLTRHLRGEGDLTIGQSLGRSAKAVEEILRRLYNGMWTTMPAMPVQTGKLYTVEEEKFIRTMRTKGRPFTYFSQALGRSPEAVEKYWTEQMQPKKRNTLSALLEESKIVRNGNDKTELLDKLHLRFSATLESMSTTKLFLFNEKYHEIMGSLLDRLESIHELETNYTVRMQ